MKRKGYLAIFLAVSVFFSCFFDIRVGIPNVNNALASGIVIGNSGNNGVFTYDYDLGGYAITGLVDRSFSGILEIPESIDGINVTSIGRRHGHSPVTSDGDILDQINGSVFSKCTGITGIVIPKSITNISNDAFLGCTGIESITVDTENANYSSCGNCLILTDGKTLVLGCKNSEIPDDGSVTSIGENAFLGCFGLENITIPECITEIGNNAFKFCIALNEIRIPDSVRFINSYAFNSCLSLKRISIGSGTTYIGDKVFADCADIESITVDEDNATYCSDSNCLISKENKAIVLGCKNSIIPNSGIVESVYPMAFYGCKNLTGIKIPECIKEICDYAFYDCNSLSDIDIGDNVSFIGFNAFYNTAYYNSEENWENGVLYIGKYLIKANPDVINGKYQIMNNTKAMAVSSFEYCEGLTEVNIPNSVTSIVYYNFAGCTKLSSVAIPEGVKKIGYGAFEGCSGLTDIKMPKSVIEIGYDAFDYCESLTDVYYSGTKQEKENTYIDEWGNDALQNAVWHYNTVFGDVNEDGKVNNKDLTRLFQYLSGWNVYANENMLDINGDKCINNKDITRLFKYLSGWEV